MKKIFVLILMMVMTITAMAQEHKISFDGEVLNVGSYRFTVYESNCDIKYPSFNWYTDLYASMSKDEYVKSPFNYDEDELKIVIEHIVKHRKEFEKETGYSVSVCYNAKLIFTGLAPAQFEKDLENGIYHPTETTIRIHDIHEKEKKMAIDERRRMKEEQEKEERLRSLL